MPVRFLCKGHLGMSASATDISGDTSGKWWSADGRVSSFASAWSSADWREPPATIEQRWDKLQLDLEIWAFWTTPE